MYDGLYVDAVQSSINKSVTVSFRIDTIKGNIKDLSARFTRYGNYLYKRLETYSNILYAIAIIATVGLSILKAFFPGLAAIFNITYDAAVAAPNILAGVLWGVSLHYAKKKDRIQGRLVEALLQEENQLLLLNIEKAHLEHQEMLQKYQEMLKEFRKKLHVSTLLHLAGLGAGEKRASTNIYEKLRKAEKELQSIRGELTQTNQYKVSQKRWGMLSALFYVVMAAVLVSPLGPFLLAIGLSATLVAASLSLIGALFLTGSFYYAKKAHEKRTELESKLEEKIKEVAELDRQLIEEEAQEIEPLKRDILAQQEEIIRLGGGGQSGIRLKTKEELEAAFKEIGELNHRLQGLSQQARASCQKEDEFRERDARYKSYQKAVNVYSGGFYVLAAVIMLISIIFPPVGAAAIASVGVATICAGICGVAAVLLPAITSMYIGKKRKAIKEQFEKDTGVSIKQEKAERLLNDLSQVDSVRRIIRAKLDNIITEQQREVSQVAPLVAAPQSRTPQVGQRVEAVSSLPLRVEEERQVQIQDRTVPRGIAV